MTRTTVTATTTVMATTTEHRVISKHTPVPFLLEAFPVPPSHIPPSPAAVPPTSNNPPPSLPPTAPLPPLPAPSSDTVQLRRSLSSDPHSPKRTRTRNGSLSSLRSLTGTLARNDLAHPISEDGPYSIHPIQLERPRSTSPDVSAIIQATPRRRPRPNKSRSRASSLNGYRSSGSSKRLPNPHEFEVEVEDKDALDSDSSIDLHTPLPSVSSPFFSASVSYGAFTRLVIALTLFSGILCSDTASFLHTRNSSQHHLQIQVVSPSPHKLPSSPISAPSQTIPTRHWSPIAPLEANIPRIRETHLADALGIVTAGC